MCAHSKCCFALLLLVAATSLRGADPVADVSSAATELINVSTIPGVQQPTVVNVPAPVIAEAPVIAPAPEVAASVAQTAAVTAPAKEVVTSTAPGRLSNCCSTVRAKVGNACTWVGAQAKAGYAKTKVGIGDGLVWAKAHPIKTSAIVATVVVGSYVVYRLIKAKKAKACCTSCNCNNNNCGCGCRPVAA